MNPAIMLVDVASANRQGLKSFLQNQKYHVDTTADGVSAVRRCLEMQPDLVLLYDSLPDIGSFQLCHQIKKDPLNQLTPVVLLGPSPDLWDIQRGREAGAIDTWATPPSFWDLLGRIQTLLRLKKYMDEQAKSAVFALARSVDSKQNLRNGHSERLLAYAEQLGESLGLGDDEQLVDRSSRGDKVRMVARIAQRVEHHHRVRHGRKDRSEALFSIESLGHECDSFFDRASAKPLGNQGFHQPQSRVDGGEDGKARARLMWPRYSMRSRSRCRDLGTPTASTCDGWTRASMPSPPRPERS